MQRVIAMNPKHKRRASTSRARVAIVRVGNPTAMAPNPRRRKRSASAPKVVVIRANGGGTRRRRRNANPVSAPMIMPNRGGVRVVRRRRSRNPSLNMMAALKTGLWGLGVTAGVYVAQRYFLGSMFYKATEAWNSPDNRSGILKRAGVRFVLGSAAAAFFPGLAGTAAMAAFMYPSMGELHAWYNSRTGQTVAPETLTPGRQTYLDGYGTGYNAPLDAPLDGGFGDVLDGLITRYGRR